jgi:molybdate transport system ATP-binding protein
VSAGLQARLLIVRGEHFKLDVALDIPPGETAVLLGPNGSGKSTAVAALAGLLPIDDGRIELAGSLLDDPGSDTFVPPESRRVGVMFQDYLLFPHLSVLENVAFGLRSRHVDKGEAGERARAWLRRLGLEGLERRKPGGLSGGQAQRVALARALVTEPDLLLLDEPLSALDVSTRVELRRLLVEHLDDFAGPRLLITHDPTEAFLLADVIHVVESGSVTQVGSADDIRLRPQTPYVADLAGANLLAGLAADGVVLVGNHPLHIADHSIVGPVLATIRPMAISIYHDQPDGSPRNTWDTSVELVEHLGDTARLQTGGPIPLTAEITAESLALMGLAEGARVWVSIKATDIGVAPGEKPLAGRARPE